MSNVYISEDRMTPFCLVGLHIAGHEEAELPAPPVGFVARRHHAEPADAGNKIKSVTTKHRTFRSYIFSIKIMTSLKTQSADPKENLQSLGKKISTVKQFQNDSCIKLVLHFPN